MSGKILLLNFDPRFKKRMEITLAELGEEYSLEEIASPADLDKRTDKIHSVFYLHTKNEQELKRVIKGFKEAQKNTPVNVIFKKKDFHALLSSLDLSLSSVLYKDYLPGELQQVLLKSDLRGVQFEELNLPVKPLLELLSAPIKIKNDRDLYRQLYSYFKSFKNPIEFSLYGFQKEDGHFERIEGPEVASDKAFQAIKDFSLPKLFIGKCVDISIDESRVQRAFPVYQEEGRETWCVCSMSADDTDYVLNNLFFRYLENTLIFRKNLSRVSASLDLANKDDVTGLFNQRKLVTDLAETIEHHEALESTFSVMFLDVDHFKNVNDNFGHIVGSQMLTEIGKELQDVLRSSDKIYRYGGDEFVVLMPEVNIDTVHKIAVRVRETVKRKSFNVGEAKDYQLSLSIGIAEYPTDARTANEIIEFADKMMYVSKKSGRGKVFHIGEVQDDFAGSE